MWWRASFECKEIVNDGEEVGDTHVVENIEADTEESATMKAEAMRPSNWEVSSVFQQKERFGPSPFEFDSQFEKDCRGKMEFTDLLIAQG